MSQIERAALKHLHYHLYNRQLVGSRRITEGAQPALNPVTTWRGGMSADGRQVQEGGDIFHLGLIHVIAWQNQHNVVTQ